MSEWKLKLLEDWPEAILQLFPESGSQWLQSLPETLEHCTKSWAISLRPPQRESTASYVISAQTDDGRPAFLKCGLPDNKEFVSEAWALRCFDGRGAVRLLQVDFERGAMLIERAVPGHPLSMFEGDDQATRMAAVLMQRLWRPAPECEALPTLEAWALGFERMRQRYQGGTGPLSAERVDRAERLYAELNASTEEPQLLHGDLHHENIVSGDREAWLAIDPKGVIGDPAFEAAALLYNPIPMVRSHSNPKAMLSRRVDLLADVLGFSRQRIRDWALAQGMLSAWWCIEDGTGDWEYWQWAAGLME
ncbi:MAG: aminoglycoside phosphotransferase family protein [Anaerolineales bacterium]|jgi:streptomycin 6-kinase